MPLLQGHRVPTIVQWSTHIPPNSVNQQLLSSLDWFATLAHLGGYTPPASARPSDSLNLASALLHPEDASASPREFFHYYSTMEVDELSGGLTRPRLMAVRNQRYKMHRFTAPCPVGRPKTGRADWTYPDANLCLAPAANWTGKELLFDLNIDPGENVPRTPCDWDGDWPAPPSWHSGCMPKALYKATIAELSIEYKKELARVPNVTSRTHEGQGNERFPCCSPGCSPLPHCCQCKDGQAPGGSPQRLSVWASL